VTVCGIKRGSGETIWQVKTNLGQVSYALHVEHAYNADSNLIHTVVSAFFDSIGLGRRPSPHQVRQAEQWIDAVGLSAKRDSPFLSLSFGEQRLALVLRAVIKQPRLLILDEPCHGLDERSRSKVLAITDYIGNHARSTILYVTHDPVEQLSCTRQVIEYEHGRGWLLNTR
jgi:molybdate transport system ATP-binding protein